MTVFQPIEAHQTGPALQFEDQPRSEAQQQYRIAMFNRSGAPEGKIAEQLTCIGCDLAFIRKEKAALDELDGLSDSACAVILDWRSDDTKCPHFAEALADKAAALGLPVLTLAAASRPEDMRIALEAGLSTIVSMPCLLADLKQALQTLIGRTQLCSAAPDFGLRDAASLIESCRFRFRTLDDVDMLVPMIARLFPEPERAAAGLAELMINAIEHGNLEIGHERKADWLARGIYRSELMKRMQTPPFSARWAELIVNRREDGIMIVVMDQGCGFFWQDVIRNDTLDARAAAQPCGEGLAKARRESFDDVRFNHIGNQVTAFVADQNPA